MPAYKLTSPYVGAALFQIGNNVYAAAQALDQASITSGDTSIRIYQISGTSVTGGQVNTATLTPSTIGSGVRVPMARPATRSTTPGSRSA